jgi:hypothetical protein
MEKKEMRSGRKGCGAYQYSNSEMFKLMVEINSGFCMEQDAVKKWRQKRNPLTTRRVLFMLLAQYCCVKELGGIRRMVTLRGYVIFRAQQMRGRKSQVKESTT